MSTMTGGEVVVRVLLRADVRKIFALHGAHVETIFQSAIDHGIALIDTRHEVAAGHAAEGYARSTRRLGVALITAGPGFTNVITSIANAYLDRTPVLYLTGSAALRDAETNTLQAGIDQVAVVKPITKWAHQVTTPAQIARLVAQAVRVATSPPTGPVLLDIPIDVLTATLDEAAVKIPEAVLLDSIPAPQEAAVAAACELLRGAARPVLMLGAEAWRSNCGDELRRFVETSGIPVYSDFQAHGLLPADHPLYGGTFHKMDDLTARGARPDVVLALGVRFGLFTLGGSDRLVPAAAKLIHVEVDPREIGRLREVALPILADCRATLQALNRLATQQPWPDHTNWQQAVSGARAERARRVAAAASSTATPIHPYRAVAAVADTIDADTIVIGDGAEAYHWLNEVIRQQRAGSYLTHGFLGCVGFGLGLAIGAQIGHPARRVVCVTGDGAVGFTIAEFDTMVRHKLPIVVVVMNNGSWAASQHFQEMVSGAERVSGTRLGNARYHEVAAGFGCHTQRVTKLAELAPALKAALASGLPACLDVLIDVTPVPPEIEMLMSRH
ncbi:MAG TPA: thiamine pyrophosphate-binding protein [Steroidobacteraceae bacterium]